MRDGLNTKTQRAGFAGPRVAADAFALVTYDSNLFQNLRNETCYERYLALARAEAQIGNTVAAENYYQYAEHYFRSMSSDREGTKSLRSDAEFLRAF